MKSFKLNFFVLYLAISPVLLISTNLYAQTESCGVHEPQQLIVTPSGAKPGRVVAVENDIAIVADSFLWDKQVSIYRIIDGHWTLEQYLPNPPSAINFANAVCINSGRIFVAAKSAQNEPGINEGAVFVYEHNGTEWGLTQRVNLTAPSTPLLGEFGQAIDATDEHLVVGSRAHVFFYKRNGDQWDYVQSFGGTAGIHWPGSSVAVHGNTAVLAKHHNSSPSETTIDIWTNNGSAWTLSEQIPTNSIEYVDYDGTYIVAHNSNRNAALIYNWTGAVWRLRPTPQIGWGIMGNQSQAVLQYPYVILASAENNEAVVYKHDDNQFNWEVVRRIPGTDFNLTELGSSVGMHNNTIIIADELRNAPVITTIQCLPCPTDLNQNSIADLEDIFIFYFSLFLKEDPSADFNSDGDLDFFDISTFLAAYSAGCPSF